MKNHGRGEYLFALKFKCCTGLVLQASTVLLTHGAKGE